MINSMMWKARNEMEGKCLGCHIDLEKPYLFCSITCAVLAGYMSIKTNRPHKDMEDLKENRALRLELLKNEPVRVRDRQPCKCHHTPEEIKEIKDERYGY
jgi:hypothetical protein